MQLGGRGKKYSLWALDQFRSRNGDEDHVPFCRSVPLHKFRFSQTRKWR
jgi:hypothetical protein